MFDNNLIDILNYLFIPNDSGKDYIINENISFNEVDKIIEKVRKIIMDLYISCDKDYRKGIKLFEEILLDKNIELAENRIKNENENEKYNTNKNDYYKKKEEEDNKKKEDEDEKEERKIEDYFKQFKEKNKELLDKEQREQDKIDNEDKNIIKRNKAIEEAGDHLDKYNLPVPIKKDINQMLKEKEKEEKDKLEKKIQKLINFFFSGVCPKEHTLIRGECQNDCGACDICNKDINIGEMSFTCETCEDFDVCNSKYHDEYDIAKAYLKLSKSDNNEEDIPIKNNTDEHMSMENNSLSELNQLNQL